jgi:hypothetical protein
MRRGPRFLSLLETAETHTRLISFEDLEDGQVEVLWLSKFRDQFSVLERFVAEKPEQCLSFLIALEEHRELERTHGEVCACEDCCIARVDRERSGKRKS